MSAAALAAAIAIPIAILMAGCSSSSSKPTVSPSVSAAAHAAEQRGIKVIETCTPNGKAMIGAVVSQTARPITYLQVIRYFKSRAHRALVWACATKQAGSASVPGTSPKAAMETCFGNSDAVRSLVDHPIRSAHHSSATATALVNAAAACIGKYV